MPNEKLVWVIVLVNVVLCATADTVATMAWERKTWPYIATVVVISPIVFLSFGYVGSQFGLSVAASLINSLVVIGPVMIGLMFRKEWENMPWQMYLGMCLVLSGITIIALFRPK